jgi:uncharacterized protein YjiS (DUF1127 family)
MSTQIRTPINFVRRDDIEIWSKRATQDAEAREPASLRDSHIVLYAVEALVTLHASFKKWRNRRLTLRALADLNEHQLRDIGLARDENGYRPLQDLDAESKDDIGA